MIKTSELTNLLDEIIKSPSEFNLTRTGKNKMIKIKGIVGERARMLQLIDEGKLYMGEPNWKQHDLMTENELQGEVIKLRAWIVRTKRQQAQPKKLTVTRGEITKLIDIVHGAVNYDGTETILGNTKTWLRLKGFKVTEK